MIDRWDREDDARRIRSRPGTIGEYVVAEQPLPEEPFETGRLFTPQVTSCPGQTGGRLLRDQPAISSPTSSSATTASATSARRAAGASAARTAPPTTSRAGRARVAVEAHRGLLGQDANSPAGESGRALDGGANDGLSRRAGRVQDRGRRPAGAPSRDGGGLPGE